MSNSLDFPTFNKYYIILTIFFEKMVKKVIYLLKVGKSNECSTFNFWLFFAFFEVISELASVVFKHEEETEVDPDDKTEFDTTYDSAVIGEAKYYLTDE